MKKIKLKEEHIQYLINQPESGMGYQVIDIFLKNGSKLNNRVVVNAELLILEDEEIIDPDEIEALKLTNHHNK